MLQLKVLVGETLAVDGLAAHSISFCDVTSLDHEMRNDAMKHRSLVPEWLSALPNSLLSRAQVQEVVYCLWHYTTIPTSHEEPSGAYNPITILPTGWSSIVISKNTLFVIIGAFYV